MASGTITLTRTGSGYLSGQILWSSVSNGTEANTSTVTATLQLQRSALNTTTGTFKGTFSVGTATYSISEFLSLPTYTWVTIKTVTVTVSHDVNGAGNCYLYAKINGPTGTTMEGTSVSGTQTVTLDRIPRFASVISAPNFNDEENPTITYSNPAGSSVSTLEACISLDGSDADVAYRNISKTGSSYTFNLTAAERKVLRSATTGGNSRSIRFLVRTKLGSDTKVSSLKRTFTIKNPEPVITPSVTDNNDTTYALTGSRSKLIRYYSDASVTIGAEAVKEAVLTGQKVTCGSKSLSADGIISAVESGSFVFSATDNRGNTTKKTVSASFVKYIRLTCNLENNIPDTGGNMTVAASGNYFNGSFGAKSNTLEVFYRYKTYGGSYGSWKAMSVTTSGNTYAATGSVTGLDYRKTYVFQVYAEDKLVKKYSAQKSVKALPVFDWGQEDFCFHVPVDMDGQRITGIPTPEDGADAVPFASVRDFGLGTTAREVTNLNSAVQCGWYTFSANTSNRPFDEGVVMVASQSENQILQMAWDPSVGGNGALCVRGKKSGTWQPWEYINPPMELGVEYRTTERCDGKIVYVVRLSVGAMGNNATISATLGTSEANIVQLQGYAYSGSGAEMFPLISVNGDVLGFMRKSGSRSLAVKSFADLTSYTAFAIVKYTKG